LERKKELDQVEHLVSVRVKSEIFEVVSMDNLNQSVLSTNYLFYEVYTDCKNCLNKNKKIKSDLLADTLIKYK